MICQSRPAALNWSKKSLMQQPRRRSPLHWPKIYLNRRSKCQRHCSLSPFWCTLHNSAVPKHRHNSYNNSSMTVYDSLLFRKDDSVGTGCISFPPLTQLIGRSGWDFQVPREPPIRPKNNKNCRSWMFKDLVRSSSCSQ